MSVQFNDPLASADVEYEKTPALKFPTVGTTYTGTVVEGPAELQQAKDYTTGEPAFWPDGKPKQITFVVLEVDGEKVSLWAPKPSAMFTALVYAQKQAGKQILPGGTLAVKFTEERPSVKNPKFTQKIYAVKYTPGAAPAADVFADDSAQPPF